MKKIEKSELLDLQTYDRERDRLRPAVMEAKEARRIHAGPNLTFLFENRETVRYQIQEMIRAERLFRDQEIAHELATYNELLGGPGALGCSLLIEITDPADRDVKLRRWLALLDHLYLELPGGRKVRPTYDPRQVGEDRLSSVQYLQFDVKGEAPVALGADLPELTVRAELTAVQRAALSQDLAAG